MPFACALSTNRDSRAAAAEAVAAAGLDRPDVAVAFFTPDHDAAAVLDGLRHARHVLGCSAQGVLSGPREVESGPALSLLLLRWARPVRMTPFHLTMERTADGPALFGRPDALAEPAEAGPRAALVLGDPYTFPADLFLDRLHDDAPGVPVLGGMASGAEAPGDARLLGDAVRDEGAVGLLLEGECGLRPVVSQGCRPVGPAMIVTKAQDGVIFALGGVPPVERLRELYRELSPEDRELFRHGLHLGRAASEYGGDKGHGDFVIRNVLGVDRATGAMTVGDRVRVGQTVRFQLRDAASASDDLRDLLTIDVAAHERRPAAALVFSCNGRGSRLFGRPDHDATAVRAAAGPVPLAGFFAAGEVGPVGGRNFVHGFTASVALFDE